MINFRLFFTLLFVSTFFVNCSKKEKIDKGFSVSESIYFHKENKSDGLSVDSLSFPTRPRGVLSTGFAAHRLTPVFKISYDKKGREIAGGINYHMVYDNFEEEGKNNWHSNFLPGLEAVYGFNMVNVAHNQTTTQVKSLFFPQPVLIKTLYFPSFSKDTLEGKPIKRDYYMVSCYDEDTNLDSLINLHDLRRFYLFDLDGNNMGHLIPKDHSVISSTYDRANDFMYVNTIWDANNNGTTDKGEKIRIFWIDLKKPERAGRQY